MVINLEMKISCLKHGYKPTNENKLFKTWIWKIIIYLQMKISCLKHGYKPKNENKLFKTWL